MAKENIWKILESVAQSQAVSAQLKEEHDREIREVWRIVRETAQQIKQVDKQLGELGNKWGSFTEGLAWPSLQKLLMNDFQMDFIGQRQIGKQNGRSLELDVLTYDYGSRNEAYIVEIKSRLTEADIEQIVNTLSAAPKFFPVLQGRKLFGILASVDIPDNARKAALKAGLYVAQISDDTFKLSVPKEFTPSDYGSTPRRNGQVNGRKKRARKN